MPGTRSAHAIDGTPGERPSPEPRNPATAELAPWVEKLVRLFDETLRIPGTDIYLGLDPILGFLLPGAGDAITSTGSVSLLLVALKERIPTIAILRMIMNIAIDTLVGVVPFLGDAFDLFFRSNRRNLDIIEKYRNDPKAKPGITDYLLVFGGIALAIANLLLPFLVVYGLGMGALVALWRAIAGS